jgi:hypothetical protein
MSTIANHTFANYCNNLNLTVSLWLVNVADYPQYADCLVNSTGNRFECSGEKRMTRQLMYHGGLSSNDCAIA